MLGRVMPRDCACVNMECSSEVSHGLRMGFPLFLFFFLGDLECKALATKCTGYRTTAYSKERRQHFARSGTIFISPSPQFHADSVQEKPVLSFLVLAFFTQTGI